VQSRNYHYKSRCPGQAALSEKPNEYHSSNNFECLLIYDRPSRERPGHEPPNPAD